MFLTCSACSAFVFVFFNPWSYYFLNSARDYDPFPVPLIVFVVKTSKGSLVVLMAVFSLAQSSRFVKKTGLGVEI